MNYPDIEDLKRQNYANIIDGLSRQITDDKTKIMHMLIKMQSDIKCIVNDEQYAQIEKLIDEVYQTVNKM